MGNWKFRNAILETVEIPKSHTSENITNNLKSVKRNWQIKHKMCVIVRLGAANKVKAINDIIQDNIIKCTAQFIKLSVNAGHYTVKNFSS